VPRTQKGWTFGKRHQAKPEGVSGIRDQDLKEQLHLGSKRTSSKIFRSGDCDAKSQTASQDLENNCEDMMVGSAPSDMKEE
jgi:hypothetical protein